MQSIRGKSIILQQIIQYIPGHLVNKLAKEYEIDKKARTFSPFSHIVTMLYGQLSHALSLNDICDALKNHARSLFTVRKATAPSRNGLSHANKVRNGDMAEKLFWMVLESFKSSHHGFNRFEYVKGVLKRFKRAINVVDSTTIQLVANCIDWAKHRKRKAAAKCHMRLDLQSFLPRFAIVDSAKHSDPAKAYDLCSDIKEGEIVIFDKAYVDTVHLWNLTKRGIFWVTRAKDNMFYNVVSEMKPSKITNILKDEIVTFICPKTKEQYPGTFRRIEARVMVDNKETVMVFITNNFDWSAGTICDLYKARWAIEVFFKQIKQTLQLSDFFGNSQNAIKWQIWTALLAYILLRLISALHKWEHSFSRMFTLLRAALWSYANLKKLIETCGTASVKLRMRATPDQAYLPGVQWKRYGTA
jgi:hypothetical protein